MRRRSEPLISEQAIHARIVVLAAEISRDFASRELVLAVVLKGALMFAADLSRLTVPIASACAHTQLPVNAVSRRVSHRVPEENLARKNVLITRISGYGLFHAFLLTAFVMRNLTRRISTLLDKPLGATSPRPLARLTTTTTARGMG